MWASSSTEFERGTDYMSSTTGGESGSTSASGGFNAMFNCFSRTGDKAEVAQSELVYFWSSRVALFVHFVLAGGVAGVAGASYYFTYGSSTSPLVLGIIGAVAFLEALAGLVAFPMRSKPFLSAFLYVMILDALAMFVGACICFSTIDDAQNDLEDRWRKGVSTTVIPFTTLADNQKLTSDLLISLGSIAMADVFAQLILSIWLWVQLYRHAEAHGRENGAIGEGAVGSVAAVATSLLGTKPGAALLRYHGRAMLSIAFCVFAVATVTYTSQTYDTCALGAENGMELLLTCFTFACGLLVLFPITVIAVHYDIVDGVVSKVFQCSIVNVHVQRTTSCGSWWKPGDVAALVLGLVTALFGLAESIAAVLLLSYGAAGKTWVSAQWETIQQLLPPRLANGTPEQFAHLSQGQLAVSGIVALAAGLAAIVFALAIATPSIVKVIQRQRSGVRAGGRQPFLDEEESDGVRKPRTQSTQLVSSNPHAGGAHAVGAAYHDGASDEVFGNADPVPKYGAFGADDENDAASLSQKTRAGSAKPCACGACGTCCLMTLPSTPAQVVVLFIGIFVLVLASTAVVGVATAGVVAFGLNTKCNTLDRTLYSYTQILTPDELTVASLLVNVDHTIGYGKVTIALETDEEAAARALIGDPVITIQIDISVPNGVTSGSVSDPFNRMGSPPLPPLSPCNIPTDLTCSGTTYTYIEDEDLAQAILTVTLDSALVQGACEASSVRITVPQGTIVQTSMDIKTTTSSVLVYAPLEGDVGGFPRWKTVDVVTDGGAVLIKNLFGVGGEEITDGFSVKSNGGPVELNTVKAGPIAVNSGGGAIVLNSTLSITFLSLVLANMYIDSEGGSIDMLGQIAGDNATFASGGGNVVATNVGAVFGQLMAFETEGGSLTASTFICLGGENITIASGGGAVKLSAIKTNALNVTTSGGTANIAVLLLGLDVFTFEGITLPYSGTYLAPSVYVDSGTGNQKHSAMGAGAPVFADNITGIFTATSGRINVGLQEALYLGKYDLVTESGKAECSLENVPSPLSGEICSLGNCGYSTLWVKTDSGDIQMRCVCVFHTVYRFSLPLTSPPPLFSSSLFAVLLSHLQGSSALDSRNLLLYITYVTTITAHHHLPLLLPRAFLFLRSRTPFAPLPRTARLFIALSWCRFAHIGIWRTAVSAANFREQWGHGVRSSAASNAGGAPAPEYSPAPRCAALAFGLSMFAIARICELCWRHFPGFPFLSASRFASFFTRRLCVFLSTPWRKSSSSEITLTLNFFRAFLFLLILQRATCLSKICSRNLREQIGHSHITTSSISGPEASGISRFGEVRIGGEVRIAPPRPGDALRSGERTRGDPEPES